jgi:hypothetical protein
MSERPYTLLVLVVLVQTTYLSFDLLEALFDDIDYGIVAGVLMIVFGLMFILFATYHLVVLLNYTFNRNITMEFIQGSIYFILGLFITLARCNLI